MEMETAVRRELLRSDTVRGYVQDRVFPEKLLEKIDGTGKSAIVVERKGGWASSDPTSSAEFPVIEIRAYVDPTRDENGGIKADDAGTRAMAVIAAIRKEFKWRRRGTFWGSIGRDPGVMVTSVSKPSEPIVVREKDQHGDQGPLGDVVYAMARWNFGRIR